MRKTALPFAAVAALFGATMAMAQEAPYTFEELQAMVPDLTMEMFDAIDTNNDGEVDEEELAAAQDAGLIPPIQQ